MAFVNEYIATEDVVRYGLELIDLKYIVGGTRARAWTIDRENNCYLRNVANGREDVSHLSTWNLLF